jgi:hypothetical protein
MKIEKLPFGLNEAKPNGHVGWALPTKILLTRPHWLFFGGQCPPYPAFWIERFNVGAETLQPLPRLKFPYMNLRLWTLTFVYQTGLE